MCLNKVVIKLQHLLNFPNGVGQAYGEEYGLGLFQEIMLGLILEKIKGNEYEKISNYKV